jgi:hypothetical protein
MEFFDKFLHIQIRKHDEQYSMIFHINCLFMWRFIDIEIYIFGSTLKWYKYTFLQFFFVGGHFYKWITNVENVILNKWFGLGGLKKTRVKAIIDVHCSISWIV